MKKQEIKFEKVEDSKNNKIFLHLAYMSGDADAYEYNDIDLDIAFDSYKDKLDEIKSIINDYKLLADITDINSSKHLDDYKVIEKLYGVEIANLYDNVPGDSTVDHQFKAHLSSIKLVAYDNEGNKYESYT